jgi:hypothetical protein
MIGLKGHVFAPVTARVERERLREFLDATGETNAAMTAPDAPIPPTYLFCLEMLDAENPFGFVEEIGIDITSILHAGQDFAYHAPVRAGDSLVFEGRLANVFEKKGGLLTFLVQEVAVTNQHGVRVADIRRTIVLQHDAALA